MSTVVYLYGFVPTGASAPDAFLAGIDDRAVEVLDMGSFAAAYSELDADRFGEHRVEEIVGNLKSVARHGARHESVVTWFADHSTIVPARLFTMFSAIDALREAADDAAESIRSKLVRFRDLREWDLKVSYDLEELIEHLGELSDEVAAEDAEIAAAAPGRRYLLEKRRDESARRRAGDTARRLARHLVDGLRPLADEVAELELPALRNDLPVVLNAALLVPASKADELQRTATKITRVLEGRGIHAALSGPWAPYRFMTEDA